MIYSVDFVKLAGNISHIDVSKYLHALSWVEMPTKRKSVKIFQLERNNKFCQIDLPASRDLSDYNAAMYRAIQYIADSIHKSVEQVILELLNPLSDVIRLRVNEPDIVTGSIFIDDAINLYDNAKKLLIATVMDVVHPQLFHFGRPGNTLVDFVNNCKFGQTEIGSYVVSIVCPISKLDKNQVVQLSLFSEEEEGAYSLTRKMINKLITSVDRVKKAIGDGNLDDVIYRDADTESCISANFLDALSGINICRKNSMLDIEAIYAPTIRKNTLDNPTVSIDHDYYSPIETLVKKIKGVHESEKNYIGLVKKLDATPELFDRKSGKVTIVYLNEKQKATSATMVLSAEQYDAAVEAHRWGKTIKVSGAISKQTNKIIDCNSFEVLE